MKVQNELSENRELKIGSVYSEESPQYYEIWNASTAMGAFMGAL